MNGGTRMEMRLSPFRQDKESQFPLDPERIRCARETAELSKVQLARLLDVDPKTISNYETTGAPQSKAFALAETLGVRPSYFTVLPSDPTIEDLNESQVWFRSLRKSTVKQRKSAVGHGRNAILLFQWVSRHFLLPQCDLPMEDGIGATPEAAAMALRGDWGYGENPLPEMINLAESHGIRVFGLPSVGKEVDAFSFMLDGTPYIAVDLEKTPERIRFDIAHEIGHLIMHETALSEPESGIGTRDIEGEAHAFASQLLMPERRVKALIPHHASLQQIFEAKKYFKVAAMAMVYRAHALNRITDWEYRSMCSRLTSLGYRSAEPKGIAMEQSQVFRFVARANQKKGISINTIGEETGLSNRELHDLSFGNFLMVTEGGALTSTSGGTGRPKLELHVNKHFVS